MKRFLLFALLLSASTAFAQNDSTTPAPVPAAMKMPAIDKSPMDMAYYPADYPVLRIQNKATEPLAARVIYSRPQKGGRTVFGELIEYGKVWRLGANEATEIELYRDVKVSGKKLAKGRYTLYAIPTASQWTVIFNKDTDVWGAFKYDEKKDALRVDVPVQPAGGVAEAFSMQFAKSGAGADLVMAWDTAMVKVPINFQ